MLSGLAPVSAVNSGYCLIVDWHERVDVKEYTKTESNDCYFGFQLSFSIRDLPDGEYQLAVLEVGDGASALVGSRHSIIVRR